MVEGSHRALVTKSEENEIPKEASHRQLRRPFSVPSPQFQSPHVTVAHSGQLPPTTQAPSSSDGFQIQRRPTKVLPGVIKSSSGLSDRLNYGSILDAQIWRNLSSSPRHQTV
ncbi:hypothetical protein MLD38_004903 [Melastoma candidum]|uniref:Uncharacterized protein n=1 Tax=Melastoma candidum TaxID=119954 RepID=A0ACB9S7L9_9MYRT|nr:hypothetical protein MLD38_004903 [Melastoma candidum]